MIPHWTHRRARKIVCLISLVLTASGAKAQAPFHLLEATIDGIHAEMRAGRLSCGQLVQAYLNRIKAYDQAGPALNAIQNVNSDALKTRVRARRRDAIDGDALDPVRSTAFPS